MKQYNNLVIFWWKQVLVIIKNGITSNRVNVLRLVLFVVGVLVIVLFNQLKDFVVPNTVHFIHFDDENLTFIDAVCILAALKNQKPEKLIIHTNQRKFDAGKYWHIVKNHELAKGRLTVRHMYKPIEIFGQTLSQKFYGYHAGDVARLEILMEFGGIYLDMDSYVVKSLDEFRKYETTVGHENGWLMSNQIIIASKGAPFLRFWYESYRDYRPREWYYNAGEKPTEILREHPGLVYELPKKLGEREHIPQLIYLNRSDEWKSHYAIHLAINHQYVIPGNASVNATYPVVFNETNILKYQVNIRDMALDVYPFDDHMED